MALFPLVHLDNFFGVNRIELVRIDHNAEQSGVSLQHNLRIAITLSADFGHRLSTANIY